MRALYKYGLLFFSGINTFLLASLVNICALMYISAGRKLSAEKSRTASAPIPLGVIMKRQVLILTILLSLTNNFLFGQTPNLHIDTIIHDKNLNDILFSKADSIKNPIYLDSGLPYYNMPINSNCYTSGDFGKDTLVFCDCIKKHDTIFIEITNPTVCCFYKLTIQIIKLQFHSNFYCSYDISPAHVFMTPNKQTLILKNLMTNSGDIIEGYISFDGTGKYQNNTFRALTKEEKNKIFSGKVDGYFKCKIE